VSQIADQLEGLSPADIEAVCQAAKRFALMRVGEGQSFPPLSFGDFEMAIHRIRILP
jgi:SpoVK/Ycf46/Vps4 family AAA+-type ATPase